MAKRIITRKIIQEKIKEVEDKCNKCGYNGLINCSSCPRHIKKEVLKELLED